MAAPWRSVAAVVVAASRRALIPAAAGFVRPARCFCEKVSSQPDQYTGVKISYDDFHYVERLIPPLRVPTPPKHERYPTPSGWSPPRGIVRVLTQSEGGREKIPVDICESQKRGVRGGEHRGASRDPTMSGPLVLRVLASAGRVAERAAELVRSVLRTGDLGIVIKENVNDLQTKADRLAQQSICTSLALKFPKLTIIGEEDLPPGEVDAQMVEDGFMEEILGHKCPAEYENVKEEELVVWVDPLDGTKEYTEGLLDNVTVLIGIAYKGKAIAGVINQPFFNYQAGEGATLGRTVWGLLGLGAFGYVPASVPAGKRVITTTRSHSNPVVSACVDAMEPTDVLRVGGAGNKVLLLIEGKASAYVFASLGCKKWDTCAPEAILHAVGGKLTDMHGNSFEYHKEVKHMNSAGVLAALTDYEYYAARVPPTTKAALKP
ncbi:3'(2'),5'-bisphosphate nucleotidase 1 isoform X2 [Petromyzon marinus]|uniref:3'(2'),5'-bisphosphate nucleotidase 1 n=3 Tax=Petromyzon marinus TaxID=7757 RepID=A0AAJ7SR73_PETMA|nr:3'(2'),5'-bisphosphate nucleotidase 1 isoform X2 [Petromyzon marinus]